MYFYTVDGTMQLTHILEKGNFSGVRVTECPACLAALLELSRKGNDLINDEQQRHDEDTGGTQLMAMHGEWTFIDGSPCAGCS